jgi:acetyl-CoA carboxylase alpha subunit
VIKEPEGFDRFHMDKNLPDIRREIAESINRLMRVPADRIVEKRREKFLGMRGL